jgi:hypothetical protein
MPEKRFSVRHGVSYNLNLCSVPYIKVIFFTSRDLQQKSVVKSMIKQKDSLYLTGGIAHTMDLTAFTAKGFPGDFDRAIAEVGVAGIDRQQSQSTVRLCPETEQVLYGDYSPTHIRYLPGARPELEQIVAQLPGATQRERAIAAMNWVWQHVQHPHTCGPLAPNRAHSEEQLIGSQRGWCNEQARVFIALCEVMEIPARLCFLFHANARCGHTTAEAFLENRWAFFDPTFNLSVELPDGRLAEARELSGPYRELAHQAYHRPLQEYYARTQPFVEDEPGWNPRERPEINRGGDLLAHIGFCNYIVEGAEAVSCTEK